MINTQKLNLIAVCFFLCTVLSLSYFYNFNSTKVSLGEINSPKQFGAKNESQQKVILRNCELLKSTLRVPERLFWGF